MNQAPDAGSLGEDGGVADAGEPRRDAGVVDGGTGPEDAGVADAGVADSGVVATDAGTPDAGVDAGIPDGGAPDAGSCTGPTTLPAFSTSPTALQACGVISAPGTYVLSADLTSDDGPCLTLSSANAVKLDCAGHTVTGSQALSVTNVEGFEVTNCTFESPSQTGSLYFTNPAVGAFHGNTIHNFIVTVENGRDLHAYANHFNGFWQQDTTQGSSVSCNTMVSPYLTPVTPGLIISRNGGSQNRFEQNQLDGLWDGIRTQNPVGADDGIILADENHSVVRGNTIKRVWDCGFESTGFIHDVTIDANDITQAGNCGIGGWFWSSVSNTLVSNNKVDGSVYAFMFMRNFGLRPATDTYPADEAVRFDHNVFDGNTLTQDLRGNPVLYVPVFSNMGYAGDLSGAEGERVPQPDEFIITNNIFRNNDLEPDSQHGYFGSPVVPGVIDDEGGNRCPADPSGPLVCKP